MSASNIKILFLAADPPLRLTFVFAGSTRIKGSIGRVPATINLRFQKITPSVSTPFKSCFKADTSRCSASDPRRVCTGRRFIGHDR